MKYIPIILMVGSIIWITIDIVTGVGVSRVTNETWKLAVFTWWIYIGGILTHHFWVRTKDNSDFDVDSLENSRDETK